MSILNEIELLRHLVEMFWWRCHETPESIGLKHKVSGTWQSISYREWWNMVDILASCLRQDIAAGDFVCLISVNRPEWTYVDLATMLAGGIVAPVYPTSVSRDIGYIINDCHAKLIFCADRETLEKVLTLRRQGSIPSLRKIIVFDSIPDGDIDPSVISFSDYLRRGRRSEDTETRRALSAIGTDQVMTLIYTSGTTGNPKGVMLSHGNILSNIKSAARTIGEHYFHEGIALSFLPLSHSLERSCGYYLAIMTGVTIAFAESLPKLLDNFMEIRPTILVSVPRIYEKIYAGLLDSATTAFKRKILLWALHIGRLKAFHEVEGTRVDAFFDLMYQVAWRLVFSKLHQRLGGRFRFAACGGAPLSKEIAIFLKGAGILVIEGYGLTETSPILTLNGPDHMRFGSVGRTLPGVELKLEPDPEGLQGTEILARGPNIMKGYYGKPAETAATITEDGWLHTGDIGYIDDEGFLFITDRKKELIKTSGGKFVAPAPIENRLRENTLIEQACIVGNMRRHCSVLIYPNRTKLERELGRALPEDAESLSSDPQVRAVFQKIIDEVNRDLNTWERLKKFAFLPRELTTDSGELTPTLKMKRRIIDDTFRDVIDRIYLEA